jgi:uncharacterized protein
MKNSIILISILFINSILNFNITFAQSELNHTLLIENIQNYQNIFYEDCIKKYDDYIQQNQDNFYIQIEKCKFIANAQYDDVNEVNPNQKQFDSCYHILIKKYPIEPEVLLYQLEIEFSDLRDSLLNRAEQQLLIDPKLWTSKQKGSLYFEKALSLYNSENYTDALVYFNKAIDNDCNYKSSITYAEILIKTKNKKEAINVLINNKNINDDCWILKNKAEILFDLKEYSAALTLYETILKMDSSVVSLNELAETFDKVGEYEIARSYLVSDTSIFWDKNSSLMRLFIHDLKHGDGKTAIATYNKCRDIGFYVDPLGLFRINLLLQHPFQQFKWRDILSILIFLLLIALLFVIPSIWILPVYFIGQYWNFKNKTKSYESLWGLKKFWFISFGYLLANFCAFIVSPENLYRHFDKWDFTIDTTISAQSNMIFVIVFAFFALLAMYKVSPQILYTKKWSFSLVLLISLGSFVLIKILTGIYILIASKKFGIDIEQIANLSSPLLLIRETIQNLFSEYGKLLPFIIIGIIGPIYEEIIFRGVILDGVHRYLNFWSANVIQSLLFAVIHYNLFLFPFYFVFGFITGIFRKQSGGLLAGIIFHVVNNSISIFYLMHLLAKQ